MRLTKLFSAILAAVLVLAGVSVAQSPSAQAAGKTYITISASPTVRTLAQSTTITTKYYKSGTLQKSGTLYLQYKSGTKWVNVRTLKISSTGTTKTKVKPTVNRTYRVATSKNKVVSPSVSVKLKTGFAISLSKTSADKGEVVKFATSNFNKGKPRTGKVQLQYYKNGKWNTLKTLTLKDGKASYSRASTTTLKWRFRYPTTGAVTKSVTLKVKPKLTLTASASSLVSGKSATLTVGLQRDGKSVTSEKVTLQSNTGSGWTTLKSLTVKSGKATTTVAPTKTTSYRVRTSDSLTSATRSISVTQPATLTYWVDTNLGLNLRAEPDTSAASLLPKLGYGEKVTALSETRVSADGFSWINIKTSDGRVGWVADIYLSKTQPTDSENSFVFTGSGYGHGIGMSQYGAYQMAREGNNATAILKHYYTGTSVGQQAIPTDLQNIKIQVLGPETFGFSSSYGDTYTTRTITFANATATGATWRLRTNDGTSIKAGTLEHFPVTYKLRITKSGTSTKAEVLDADGDVVATTTDALLRVHLSGTTYYNPSSANAVATIPGANGTYNNGRLEISVINGVLNVTNQLKLNTEYLYGIAEMPSSWGSNGGEKALQAQAIAARTYALKTARTSATDIAKCNCNLVDDVRHQNFTGWKKEGEGTSQTYGKIWSAAVDATNGSATSGLVVKSNGSYISTYYFSASGGKTANSEDVWASSAPYLVSVGDSYSLNAPGNTNKSWTQTLTQAKARALFGDLADVASISVSAKYTSGQVKTLKATSSTGKTQSITKKADAWRTALGTKASWITSIKAN